MSASAPRGPTQLFSDARSLGSIGAVIGTAVTAVILATTDAINLAINALAQFFTAPVFEGGTQGAEVVIAFVGGIANTIQAGQIATSNALVGLGAPFPALGGFIYAIAIAGAGAWIMAWILQQTGTSDFVLGLVADFPGPFGAEEDDED